MTEDEIRPYVGKPVRITLDDGRVLAGTLHADGGGGNVLTLVIAPGIPAGRKVTTPLDHYSLLRSIEDAFGLPLLREAAAPGTAPMTAFWS